MGTFVGDYHMMLTDWLLDASIYYSFDLSGFKRHSKEFSKIELPQAKNILITGGTSGIGLALAEKLSKNKVTITGRNEAKAEAILGRLKGVVSFQKLELAHWRAVLNFVLSTDVVYDHIVLNAGGMPGDFTKNSYGVESQFASQVVGHYLLLRLLYEQKKLADGARVIWVSSGGMYLKKFDSSIVFKNDRYNKVTTYANVKKAQVIMLEMLAREFPLVQICGMHPGWVETPGLVNELKGFSKKMKGRLRSPEQGADTLMWLLASNTVVKSGEFYFDRKTALKNYFPIFLNFKDDVDNLRAHLEMFYQRVTNEE